MALAGSGREAGLLVEVVRALVGWQGLGDEEWRRHVAWTWSSSVLVVSDCGLVNCSDVGCRFDGDVGVAMLVEMMSHAVGVYTDTREQFAVVLDWFQKEGRDGSSDELRWPAWEGAGCQSGQGHDRRKREDKIKVRRDPKILLGHEAFVHR